MQEIKREELKLPDIDFMQDPAGESDKDCVIFFGQACVPYSNPYEALKDARKLVREAKRLVEKLEREIERVEFLAL